MLEPAPFIRTSRQAEAQPRGLSRERANVDSMLTEPLGEVCRVAMADEPEQRCTAQNPTARSAK